jgi:predicted RNA-binding Zn-ribbon protein involved in translation (DUF1610 family)
MGKMMLRCDSCKYKFSRNVVPNLCPFCGKATISKDTHTSADSILREVDELESRMIGRQ